MSGTLLDGFTKLNDITSIYRPKQADKNSINTTPLGPRLIVFCSWMGAAPKHIAKYIDGHKSLFPNSEILLIESTLPNMFLGSDLSAASEVIESFVKDSKLQSTDDAEPYVLLQAFSNGGANNATYLGERLLKTNDRLPFRSVILDCCPGKGEAKSATYAMSLSLPKQPLVRAIGSWVIYSTAVVLMSIYVAFGWEDTLTRLRRRFNDVEMFSAEVPKLYLYSENDALVNWQHVHEHAEDAKQKGYSVREEKFSKAAHCALLMEDSGRYWGAVKEHVLGNTEK